MEVLSQDEINELLTAINAGTPASAPIYDASGRRIRLYDFKRPDRVSKDHINTLKIIHEELASKLADFFSGYLKCKVSVKLSSVDQLTYEEFVRSVPTPSCLSIISFHPLKGSAIIETDPAIYTMMLDILFGGNADYFQRKELTDLEKFVMGKLMVRSFDAIRESWKKIIEFNPEFIKIETNPQYIELLPLNEMTVLVTYECKVESKNKYVEGMINMLYPYPLIKSIKNKITSQYYNSGVEAMNEPIKSDMDQMLIPVSVVMGEKKLQLKTIREMEVGNILELDKLIDRDMDIYAGNVLIARGEVVVIDEKFGIRVTETCSKFL
jgi:flagellar motor switch protein FliM